MPRHRIPHHRSEARTAMEESSTALPLTDESYAIHVRAAGKGENRAP